MKLYDTEQRIKKELKKIDELTNEKNKQIIREFYTVMLAEGISKRRLWRYLQTLRLIAQKYDKPFNEWKKEDIIKFLADVNSNGYALETVNEYKKGLRKLFKWLHGEDWMHLRLLKTKKNRNKKPDILEEDEVLRIIDAANNERDKAMIAVCYEAGLRIGELASIKIKDVVFDEENRELKAKIRVKGKTGERIIPLRMSVKYLLAWLEKHPKKEDPEAYVFCSISNNSLGEQMRYESFLRLFKRIAEKAGIKKNVHPHMLRHTRATILAANNVAEYIMCKYFGWVVGSDVPRVYVDLSAKDLDKVVDAIYGFEESAKPKLAKPRRCPRCGKVNEPTAKYCSVCAFILDEKLRAELELEEPRVAKDLMSIIMQNPEMLAQVKEMIELVQKMREKPELMQKLKELRDENVAIK